MLLLVFLGLWCQVFCFVVCIPADPVQDGKAVPNRNTGFGAKLNSSPCLATHHPPNVWLNQVHDAVGHAAGLGVQQDALLAVQLTDHKELPLPMALQSRKRCTRGDQGIDGIKISL
jgi:hypothetical protein